MINQKALVAQIASAQEAGDHHLIISLADEGIGRFPDILRFKQAKMAGLRLYGHSMQAWTFGRSLPESEQIEGAILAQLTTVGIELSKLSDLENLIGLAETKLPNARETLRSRLRLTEHCHGHKAALVYCDTLDMSQHLGTSLELDYLRLLASAGRRAMARAGFRARVKAKPTPVNWLQLITFLIDIRDFENAEKHLTAQKGLSRTHPGWHLQNIRSARLAGDIRLALERARDAVSIHPKSHPVHFQFFTLLSENGQTREAEDACRAYANQFPKVLKAQITAARFLIHASSQDTLATLMERAENLIESASDVPGAYALMQAEAVLAQDDAIAAYAYLLDFTQQNGPLAIVEVKLAWTEYHSLGLVKSAIQRLRGLLAESSNNSPAILLLARCLVSLEQFDSAKKILGRITKSNPHIEATRESLLASIDLARGDLDKALRLAETACELKPHHNSFWFLKSNIEMLMGRIEDAWKSHLTGTHTYPPQPNEERYGRKPLHSLHGQILNEFRLHSGASDIQIGAPSDITPTVLAQLGAQARSTPESVACAVRFAAALRWAGHIGAAPRVPAVAAPKTLIPQTVYQFWDKTDLPEQVANLVEENRQLNPEYDFRMFDERSAFTYLVEKGETAALRAFRLAQYPAAKADIFRLAVLYHDGGVFLDVDDRCLAKLTSFIDPQLRFIGYQEPIFSIGNNFLATPPQCPIMRAALDMASTAFDGGSGESLWLSTGPGVVTRAVTLCATQPDGQIKDGIWIMSNGQFQERIAPHVRLSYKATAQHWTSQFTRKSS